MADLPITIREAADSPAARDLEAAFAGNMTVDWSGAGPMNPRAFQSCLIMMLKQVRGLRPVLLTTIVDGIHIVHSGAMSNDLQDWDPDHESVSFADGLTVRIAHITRLRM